MLNLDLSSASSTSILSSARSNSRKAPINFIERNKNLITKLNEKNTKINLEPNESSVQIKCLNDLNKLNKEKPIELDISHISDQSSIIIAPNTSKQSNENHDDESSRISQNEISNQNISEVIIETSENCNKLRSELFYNLPLTQGDEANISLNNDAMFHDQIDDQDEQLNILKYDNDRSKIRSQFMKRFADHSSKRKHIIPTIIDTTEKSRNVDLKNYFKSTLNSNFDSPIMTESASSMGSNQSRFISNIDQNPDSLTATATIAASLAAVNAVTQPILNIQSKLDSKMEDVLKQLESLRKIDEKVGKKSAKRQYSDHDEDDRTDSEEIYFDSKPKSILVKQESESDARLKYLERIQENQVTNINKYMNLILGI